MSLPLYFGVLTLAPAVAALLIAGLGFARRPIARVVLALTWLGALIPLAALIYLVADLASGVPQRVAVIGPAGPGAWLSLTYRYDAFAVFGAFGISVVVAPLLLWMVARSRAAADAADAETEENAPTGEAPIRASRGGDGAVDGSETDQAGSAPWQQARAGGTWMEHLLPLEDWAGFALVLGLESAALVLFFADAIVWLGVAWVALAALAWGIGEVGAEPGDIDVRSLPLMLAGPILWLVAMLIIAAPRQAARLSDLAGVGGASIWLALLICIFLALAAGAYPFNGWVRRRAMMTPPAGFGAVILAMLPAALFAGGRTYAALQDGANLWPQLGNATPPITIAIILVLLGALTVAISGLLALNFRDGRTLVALLAAAQVGWGLLTLGIGRPLSAVALVALLATMVFGLGAMVAALFAGGMLTPGEEPDGAGPQVFGAPTRPLALAAWLLGATALLGAPLFGGFIARHLTSAAALTAAQLSIPLTGLSWVGDALLAIGIARATAPALFAKPAVEESEAGLSGAPPEAQPAAAVVQPPEVLAGPSQAVAPQRAAAGEGEDELEGAEEGAEEGEEAEDEEEPGAPRRSLGEWLGALDPAELPGLLLALLALVIGIAPGVLFLLSGLQAAAALVQPGSLDTVFQLQTFGYLAGPSQWLPSLAWIAVVILAVLAALIREITRPAPRIVRPITVEAVPSASEAQPEPAAVTPGEPVPAEPIAAELVALAEPGEVWKDLEATFDSNWTVPGVGWLLHEDEGNGEGEDDDVADEAMRALREAGRSDAEAAPPTSTPPETGGGNDAQAAGTRGEGTGEQP